MIVTAIKVKNIYIILFMSFIFLFCSYGNSVTVIKDNEKKADDKISNSQNKTTNFQLQLNDFVKAYGYIKKYYINDIDDKVIITNAIKGMINELDPHSMYLDKSTMKSLENFNSGNFVGIGIDAVVDKGLIKVISTIDDTPSHKAGMQSGDLIISINGKMLNNLNYLTLMTEISGKPNTVLSLTVFRPSEKKEINFNIKREIIKLNSVKSSHIEDGFCYVRINNFNGSTSREFQAKIEKLAKGLPNQKIKGIILDLRNNPGGVINSAVDICSYFIKNKLVVYIQGRDSSTRIDYMSKQMDVSLLNMPLVVLINEGSASASEIVAGALQDHKRAMILGNKSFGKGSVQSVALLNKEQQNGIKLTTHLYYTPNGKIIQLEGLKPDIEIQRATINFESNQNVTREKDFYNHLKNNQQISSASVGKVNIVKSTKNSLLNDYQVMQALQILKGMRFIKINNF